MLTVLPSLLHVFLLIGTQPPSNPTQLLLGFHHCIKQRKPVCHLVSSSPQLDLLPRKHYLFLQQGQGLSCSCEQHTSFFFLKSERRSSCSLSKSGFLAPKTTVLFFISFISCSWYVDSCLLFVNQGNPFFAEQLCKLHTVCE